jgi:outer membrane lipoprotein-sorting protein
MRVSKAGGVLVLGIAIMRVGRTAPGRMPRAGTWRPKREILSATFFHSKRGNRVSFAGVQSSVRFRRMAARLLFALLSMSVLRPAVAEDATEYLRKTARAYKELTSLQVEAVTERGLGDSRPRYSVVVKLYRSATGKSRVETAGEGNVPRLVLISNGKEITEYRAWSNEYTRFADGAFSVAFSPDRGSGWGEMSYETIADGAFRASFKGRETLQIGGDRVPCAIVDVEYSGADPSYSFWIAESTGLVLKRIVRFSSPLGPTKLTSTVRALTLNEPIADSVFEFTPPPGAKQTPGAKEMRSDYIAVR